MSALPSAWVPGFAAVLQLPARGVTNAATLAMVGAQLLPTDPVGTMTLTIKNMVAASRWRLEVLATGAPVVEGDATGADMPLVLPYYRPNLTLLLKVRKGTASPYYRPYDTQVTIGANGATVFVSQIPDE